jgi:hypothetical protein
MKTEKQLPDSRWKLTREGTNPYHLVDVDGDLVATIYAGEFHCLRTLSCWSFKRLVEISEHLLEHGNLDAYTKPVSKWRVRRSGHYERVYYTRGEIGWAAEYDRILESAVSYTRDLPVDELTELHQRFLDRGTFLAEGEEYTNE